MSLETLIAQLKSSCSLGLVLRMDQKLQLHQIAGAIVTIGQGNRFNFQAGDMDRSNGLQRFSNFEAKSVHFA